jgi:hypothetical protein
MSSLEGGKKRTTKSRKVEPLPKGIEQRVGSKYLVFSGKALRTSGGLYKKDLMMNKRGRIVSKKKHELGKKNKLFKKLTTLTRKGKFHLITKAEAKKALSKK